MPNVKTVFVLVATLAQSAFTWASEPSRWWIEKNTPVALNVQAALDLRLLVKVLVKRGFDIQSGEDWHGILAAAYGEARANHDFYVTKGRCVIYFVPDEEEIPSFDDNAELVVMTPFRVANNPTIYFTDDHFIKGVDGPLRPVIPDLEQAPRGRGRTRIARKTTALSRPVHGFCQNSWLSGRANG